MDLTGFTEMQLQVIDSVSSVCAQCSDGYWTLRDYGEKNPHQLYSALAKNSFIGTALPEEPVLGLRGYHHAADHIPKGAGIAGAQSTHAQVNATQPVAKFATKEQRSRPKSATSQKFSGSKPLLTTSASTGLDTLKLQTWAVRDGYANKPSLGLSLVFVDLGKICLFTIFARISKMKGRALDANEIFFDDYQVPVETLIGNRRRTEN
ncbi:MAG: hypothetical protein Q9198_008488, partial [Flavoplaca austrocitrina]